MSALEFDLSSVFVFSVSPLELILRGTLMYWFLFMVFRFVLKGDVGSLSVGDFLFVVILGDAAQNAMIGSATFRTYDVVRKSGEVGEYRSDLSMTVRWRTHEAFNITRERKY